MQVSRTTTETFITAFCDTVDAVAFWVVVSRQRNRNTPAKSLDGKFKVVCSREQHNHTAEHRSTQSQCVDPTFLTIHEIVSMTETPGEEF